jgi:hypothetical protein
LISKRFRVLVLGIAVACATLAAVLPATDASATIVGSLHRCNSFGPRDSSGNLAGECADLDRAIFDSGVGSGICNNGFGAIVQCAGISQVIELWTGFTSTNLSLTTRTTVQCGRYVSGNPPCPSGRFINPTVGVLPPSGCFYLQTVVHTELVLPQSGLRVTGGTVSTPVFADCT